MYVYMSCNGIWIHLRFCNFLMGKIVEISHAPDTHTVLLHGRLCHGVNLSVDILGHFIVPTYLPLNDTIEIPRSFPK